MKGVSYRKSERFSIQDLELEYGSRLTFKSNHALTSSFNIEGIGLLCDFWLHEENGAAIFESDIFRMRRDVVIF